MTGRGETWNASGAAALRVRPGLAGRLGVVGLVGAAYYLGARLGLGMSLVEHNVTPLWPPTGIAVAAFLLVGRSVWPGVALAALLINLPINDGVFPAVLTAAGNTLAPLVAATLLRRVGFRRQLDRLRDALAVVFIGALGSMTISATIGSAALVIFKAIPAEEFPSAWAVWWTGDAMGVLVVAPFLLSLPLFWELKRWATARWLEAGAILVVTLAVVGWAAVSRLSLLFLALPVLGLASWRLQLRGAAPAALIASVVATWSTVHGLGPLQRGSLFEQMFTLQAFNASVALTSFFLAAIVSDRNRSASALRTAAADLEARVRARTAELSAANTRLVREIEERSAAEVQLRHEEARAAQEHQNVEILQRNLLPDRMPEIPGVALAARYVPATADVDVGGDWYDVVQLPGGLVGLAIGDVAGHGLQAAATMGQVRMAVRAYAVQDPSPVSVMRGVHQLVSRLPVPEMVTLLYLLFDPASRLVRFANAGHPPALVFDGLRSIYLQGALAPPLGVTSDPAFIEVSHELWPGATLLLYTDGLVERRGTSINDGLDRLSRRAVEHASADLDELCDRVLSSLLGQAHQADDIALVAIRSTPLSSGPLRLRYPAEARMLAPIRETLRRWLSESDVGSTDESEILIACGEACSNIVQHAYNGAPGDIEVDACLVDGTVELCVRDRGQWRPAADNRGGGWGQQLMAAFMDAVDISRGPGGTEIRMRRLVRHGGDE